VHESVLHTSESNRDHNTEKKKDGSGIVRRMKDPLLNSKKKKNGLEIKEYGMLKINISILQYRMRTHVGIVFVNGTLGFERCPVALGLVHLGFSFSSSSRELATDSSLSTDLS
jgi:hypothetical protein